MIGMAFTALQVGAAEFVDPDCPPGTPPGTIC